MVERALVAKVGAIVFAGALGSPLVLTSAPAQASATFTAASARLAVADVRVVLTGVPATLADLFDVPMLPAATAVLGAESAVASSVRVVAAPAPEPPPGVPPGGLTEPLVTDGLVIASWYGPGFYGNRTACGQLYTPEIVGVAHRTLPCGTLVTITSPKGITLTVPVIDRGPFIAGRALDLSNATRAGLSCSDLCRVRMVVRP